MVSVLPSATEKLAAQPLALTRRAPSPSISRSPSAMIGRAHCPFPEM